MHAKMQKEETLRRWNDAPQGDWGGGASFRSAYYRTGPTESQYLFLSSPNVYKLSFPKSFIGNPGHFLIFFYLRVTELAILPYLYIWRV